MATSVELELLKEKIRQMPASSKKGDEIYIALQRWIPLQTDEDWLRLINVKTKGLNQREIAAEVCGTDNIWKRERFRELLKQMNTLVAEKGLFKKAMPYLDDNDKKVEQQPSPDDNKGEGNPLKELAYMRLKAKLRQTEGQLHQAKIRVKKLEKELEKYTDLSELNRAIELLMKPRK